MVIVKWRGKPDCEFLLRGLQRLSKRPGAQLYIREDPKPPTKCQRKFFVAYLHCFTTLPVIPSQLRREMSSFNAWVFFNFETIKLIRKAFATKGRSVEKCILFFWSKPSNHVWGRGRCPKMLLLSFHSQSCQVGWGGRSIFKLTCDELKKTVVLKLCAVGGNPGWMTVFFSKIPK